jgi:hypothetical protein
MGNILEKFLHCVKFMLSVPFRNGTFIITQGAIWVRPCHNVAALILTPTQAQAKHITLWVRDKSMSRLAHVIAHGILGIR